MGLVQSLREYRGIDTYPSMMHDEVAAVHGRFIRKTLKTCARAFEQRLNGKHGRTSLGFDETSTPASRINGYCERYFDGGLNSLCAGSA